MAEAATGLLHGNTIAGGVPDDLVVHIRNIHHVANLVAALREESLQQVDRDERSEITNVAVVVDGGATGVHANFISLEWVKLFHLGGHGVKQTKGHRS